jgi:hypothetical protein
MHSHLLITLLMAILTLPTLAQRISIGMTIVDSAGQPLKGAAIRIKHTKTNALLHFKFLNTDSTYNDTLDLPSTDTLLLIVHKDGYQPFEHRFTTHHPSVPARVVLFPLRSTLQNVTVTAPPYWARGDTTSFKADAYKFGNESKLRDLIQNIPGFEIRDNGLLYYRNQVVEKIMMDGNEIFGDQIKLLLNGVPVHVIDQVQALENQSSNPVLKDILQEKRVFLNLSIKNKYRVKAAFGEGEATAGSRSRYKANGTIIALRGKIRLGYIGSAENMGGGIDWRTNNDIRPQEVQTAGDWNMQHHALRIINELTANRYIRNNLVHQQVQLHWPKGKTARQMTEFGLMADRRQQTISNTALLFNGTAFIANNSQVQIRHRPTMWKLLHEVEANPTPKLRWLNRLEAYVTNTSSTSFSDQIIDSVQLRQQEKISDRFLHLSWYQQLSKKRNDQQGWDWKFSIAYRSQPQHGNGTSFNYAGIFQVNDNDYQQLTHKLLNRQLEVRSSWAFLTRKNSKTSTTLLEAQMAVYAQQNNSLLSPSSEIKPVIPITALLLSGQFYHQSLTASRQFVWKVSKAWHHSLQAKMGLASQKRVQAGYAEAGITIPTVKLSYESKLSQRITQRKQLSYFANIDVKQEPASPVSLPYGVQPRQMTSFQQNSFAPGKLRDVAGRFSIAVPAGNAGHIIFSTSVLQALEGRLLVADIRNLLFLNIDSFITRPNAHANFSISTNFYGKKQRRHVYGGISLNNYWFKLLNDGRLATAKNQVFFAYAGVKQKLLDNLTLFAHSKFHSTRQFRPQQNSERLSRQIRQIDVSVSLNYQIHKALYAGIQTQTLYTNMGTAAQNNVWLLDADLKYAPSDSRFLIALAAENLLDQQRFSTNQITQLLQAFTSLPLIRRNAWLKFSYRF